MITYGVGSRNLRTLSECLDEFAEFIKKYGIEKLVVRGNKWNYWPYKLLRIMLMALLGVICVILNTLPMAQSYANGQ